MATTERAEKELRAHYVRASHAGRRAARTEPRAATAAYVPRAAALRVELTNGTTVTIPVRLIRQLRDASAKDLKGVEVLGAGGGLHWEALDLDLSVPALIAAILDEPVWMAELGRIGGRRSSPTKAAAARRNGRKGGRPRTVGR